MPRNQKLTKVITGRTIKTATTGEKKGGNETPRKDLLGYHKQPYRRDCDQLADLHIVHFTRENSYRFSRMPPLWQAAPPNYLLPATINAAPSALNSCREAGVPKTARENADRYSF